MYFSTSPHKNIKLRALHSTEIPKSIWISCR